MAQVNVVANTEDKTLSVSLNNQVISNVEDVSVYTYREPDGTIAYVEARVAVREVSGDVVKNTTYYTQGSEQAKAALASGQEVQTDIPGFVGVDDRAQAIAEVDAFMSQQKRAF
jgi:hypothetical protein